MLFNDSMFRDYMLSDFMFYDSLYDDDDFLLYQLLLEKDRKENEVFDEVSDDDSEEKYSSKDFCSKLYEDFNY